MGNKDVCCAKAVTFMLLAVFVFVFAATTACQGPAEIQGNSDIINGEKCDGIDNDADGLVDEEFDLDADGFIECTVLAFSNDCNDASPLIHPLAEEKCSDSIDNDCDGKADNFDEDCNGSCGALGLCEKQQGVCAGAAQKCVAGTATCEYAKNPNYQDKEFSCTDNLDNDCDGLDDTNDPDCQQYGPCQENDTPTECFRPGFAAGAGVCAGEMMTCHNGFWTCNFSGIVGFQFNENSIDQSDNDCDGEVDEQSVTFGGYAGKEYHACNQTTEAYQDGPIDTEDELNAIISDVGSISGSCDVSASSANRYQHCVYAGTTYEFCEAVVTTKKDAWCTFWDNQALLKAWVPVGQCAKGQKIARHEICKVNLDGSNFTCTTNEQVDCQSNSNYCGDDVAVNSYRCNPSSADNDVQKCVEVNGCLVWQDDDYCSANHTCPANRPIGSNKNSVCLDVSSNTGMPTCSSSSHNGDYACSGTAIKICNGTIWSAYASTGCCQSAQEEQQTFNQPSEIGTWCRAHEDPDPCTSGISGEDKKPGDISGSTDSCTDANDINQYYCDANKIYKCQRKSQDTGIKDCLFWDYQQSCSSTTMCNNGPLSSNACSAPLDCELPSSCTEGPEIDAFWNCIYGSSSATCESCAQSACGNSGSTCSYTALQSYTASCLSNQNQFQCTASGQAKKCQQYCWQGSASWYLDPTASACSACTSSGSWITSCTGGGSTGGGGSTTGCGACYGPTDPGEWACMDGKNMKQCICVNGKAAWGDSFSCTAIGKSCAGVGKATGEAGCY